MRRKMAGLAALTTIVAASCGAAPPESGAMSEGIGVHGAWTIDIYNEDGTLDEHIEFENALTQGAEVLAILLSNQGEIAGSAEASVNWWEIYIGAAPGPVGGPDPCYGTVPSGLNPDLTFACAIFPVSAELGPDGQSIVLSGETQVTEDGSFINWVETAVFYDIFVGSSGTSGTKSFTGTAIPQEEVSAGQTIQVQIVISFGTGIAP